MVTELDGWWGPPPSDIPEDERPYNEDGNYLTAGRFGPRTIQINGIIVPPGGTSQASKMAIVRARTRLINTLDMIRKTGTFTVVEFGGAKQAEVQTLGRPLLDIKTQNNVLHYDIQLIASDPRKYSVDVETGTSSPVRPGDPKPGAPYDPIVSPGRQYNRIYNLSYAHTNHASQIFLVNEGDHPTWGTLRISGPITNPKVTHRESEKFLELELHLDEGDILDIDLKKRTIFLNGTESVLPKLNFDSSWFDYAPGVNTLYFTGEEIIPPQEGWAAAVNLATNPSMESAGAMTTIRKNSIQDPSFEARNGTSDVTRVNHALRSSFTGLPVGGSIPEYPSNATTDVSTTDLWSASSSADDFLSMELTALTESNDTFVDITPTDLTFSVGKYYTISGTLQIPEPLQGELSPMAATIVVRYLDTTDGLLKTKFSAGEPDITGERRLVNIFRVPEGASNVRVLLYNGSGLVWGETNREVFDWVSSPVRWDNISIVAGVDDGSYFDSSFISTELVQYSEENGRAVERRLTTPVWAAEGGVSYLVEKEAGEEDKTALQIKFVRGAELASVATSTEALGLNADYPAVTIGAAFRANTIPVTITPVLISPEVEVIEGMDPMPYTYGSSRTITPADGEVEIRSPIIKPEGEFQVGFLLQEAANTELNTALRKPLDPTDYQVSVVGYVTIDRIIVVDGTYRGSYFDGSTPSPDMLVSWEGGTVNGKSIAQSPKVAGILDGPEAVTYRSKMWSLGGTSSLAVITSDKITNVEGRAYATVTSPSWDSLPNGTYTVIAHCNAEAGEYLEGPTSRTITVLDTATNRAYTSEQAPIGSATRLFVVFEKTGPGGEIRLVSNALGNQVVRWDGILVVAGVYTDRYFDGDSEEATWSGTAHASTSAQQFKETIASSALFTEHRNAWIN